MEEKISLATSRSFGDLNVDVYEDEKKEFFMTREQIGEALEYGNPQKAIDNIISRNKERFIDNSVTLNLRATDGKSYNTNVLTLRGVMEICRLSRQPKADKFMDFVWDIMESLYRGDTVLATPQMNAGLMPEAVQTMIAQLLDEQNKLRRSVDEVLNSVKAIQEKQVENNTIAMRKEEKPQISEWRKNLYSKCNVIAESEDITVGELLHQVYDHISKFYGFNYEAEQENYSKRNGYRDDFCTMDMIEASSKYKAIVHNLIQERLWNSTHTDPISTKSANMISVDRRVLKSKKSERFNGEINNRIKLAIEQLATDLNDCSRGCGTTIRKIYKIIGREKMAQLTTAYFETYGKGPLPKAKVFLEGDNWKVLDEAIQEIKRMETEKQERGVD